MFKFRFITEKPLWANVLAGVSLLLLIFIFLLLFLKTCTHHGEISIVPNVIGKKFADAKTILDNQNFEIEIQDSVYIDSLPPSVVIRQYPELNQEVKRNRKIYLIINKSVAPIIEMPNIVGFSFRNAKLVLQNLGLKIGDTIYRPDFAINTVLEQRVGNTKIEAGAKIQAGSKITLILGNGVNGSAFPVPYLIGKTYKEASIILDSLNLSFGVVLPQNLIEEESYIYKQIPSPLDENSMPQNIRAGQLIDVFLQKNRPTNTYDTLGR